MSYVVAAGTFILQIVLAVHAVRTRRPFIWVFLILIFPLMGSLIYVIAELIPEWERRNTLHYLVKDIERFFSDIFSPR